jgi:hypothetical protein
MLFLTLVLGCNLALTNSRFNATPIVNVFYRKPIDDNIYKHSKLEEGVMVIRLAIDYGKLVKVALKKGVVGKGVGGWVKSYGSC